MTQSFQRLLFPVLMMITPLTAFAAPPEQPSQPVTNVTRTEDAVHRQPVQNVSDAMGQRLDQMLLDRKVTPRR